MNADIKIEIALEIIAMKIGLCSNNKDEEELKKLIKLREKIWHGNLEDIDFVLETYGSEMKKEFNYKGEINV